MTVIELPDEQAAALAAKAAAAGLTLEVSPTALTNGLWLSPPSAPPRKS